MADALLARLKFSNADRTWIVAAIRHHMSLMHGSASLSDKHLRKIARRLPDGLTLEHLVEIRQADLAGKGTPDATFSPEAVTRLRAQIANLWSSSATGSRLPINGRDVMTVLGIKPGKAIGDILAAAQELVDDDPALNTREHLLQWVTTQRQTAEAAD